MDQNPSRSRRWMFCIDSAYDDYRTYKILKDLIKFRWPRASLREMHVKTFVYSHNSGKGVTAKTLSTFLNSHKYIKIVSLEALNDSTVSSLETDPMLALSLFEESSVLKKLKTDATITESLNETFILKECKSCSAELRRLEFSAQTLAMQMRNCCKCVLCSHFLKHIHETILSTSN